jgi:beta-glucosidase
VEMPWLNEVAAVLQAWYPGQEAGSAIADVLFGKAEPGGRLAQTFPIRWSDNPAHSQDPEVYPGHNGKVRYEEGLFTGHRHYDKTGIQPLFPFGFGLSYTTFEWSALRVSANGDTVTAEVDVTNTGARAGSEVVQLYVEDPSPILPRPRRELKAFEKLHLTPGETRTAKMTLGPRAFACFDTAARGWVARAGAYVLQAGASAADIKSSAPITRASEWREAARK